MSVRAFVLFHNRAYTKTVSIPVSRKAHQTQLPEIPFFRIISVNRLAEFVEVVAAAMEMPSNHQGIFLPDKKNSEELFPAFLEVTKPIEISIIKNRTIII